MHRSPYYLEDDAELVAGPLSRRLMKPLRHTLIFDFQSPQTAGEEETDMSFDPIDHEHEHQDNDDEAGSYDGEADDDQPFHGEAYGDEDELKDYEGWMKDWNDTAEDYYFEYEEATVTHDLEEYENVNLEEDDGEFEHEEGERDNDSFWGTTEGALREEN